jgi:Ca-activated chloride channel family protein
MGWNVSKVHRSIALPAVLTLAAGGWLLALSSAGQVQAQDANVNIETRASGGKPASGSANRIATSIHVNSNLVLIPVVVSDRQNRMITGLAREHFRLWDDKIEQVISHFAAEDIPVSIGLVFDASGSMGGKLEESRTAVAEFIKKANPEDEFSLVSFNDHAQLRQGFTDRPEEIQNQMMQIASQGATALLDAIMLSMNEMQHAKHKRKAILIISDGGDNHSRYTTREVKDRLREADVQVYSIGIMESFTGRSRTFEELGGAALLDDISNQTGGRLFEVNDINDLSSIATKIGSALREQYILGYVPSVEKQDGKYHRVQVKIVRPKGLPALRTSFRTGYFAPSN